ncbi:ESX secretion-associated protein EspG [Mycolicibacterium sp.]|uniref:ESX secretion-associated protein EspG n=1 Tax=Mycolicibacterium sp. TaxID=2320850 RepID=UPI00093891E7|nr:hypothetical protein EB73_07700 [Mycobacterium sp. SWH-M3]
MTKIGSINVLDLDVISEHYGRDFLPYPFMMTRYDDVAARNGFEAHARAVIDRFHNGDLQHVQNWAGSYVHADIRVEGHVRYVPADTPNVRVVAHRLGEKGYFARQLPDADTIEIFTLSPYDLGAIVAESMATTRPGRLPSIVIPEYLMPREPEVEDDAVSVRARRDTYSVPKLSRSEVAALATVQTHWRPTRKWGVDSGKTFLMWVRIRDDGDYAYAPDFGAAHPMSSAQLVDRINRLIAEDVALLRKFRGTG